MLTFLPVRRTTLLALLLLCGASAPAEDRVGAALDRTMVSTSATPVATDSGACVAFRRSFTLASVPRVSTLHLFADARYMLWVNGRYVARGPARFEPVAPEYDSLDLRPYLRPGRNGLAVLVSGRISSSRTRWRPLAMAARLVNDGRAAFGTDASWRWSDRTRYRGLTTDWGNLYDTADARVEDGDWTQTEYEDTGWTAASPVAGASRPFEARTAVGGPIQALTITPIGASWWGPLAARRTPPLRETRVVPEWSGPLPAELAAGDEIGLRFPRLVLATTRLEVEADEGSVIELSYSPGTRYVCRAGLQSFLTSDAHAVREGAIRVVSGRVAVRGVEFSEALYPFSRVGSFRCSDPFLSRLWEGSVRGVEITSEDAYTDCADRERAEWMDNDPPAFDVTRVALAGPGDDGRPVFADPRLLAAMLRRTAQTLQPEGWVKAHTASDRPDTHARMEDRACDWVEGLRRYVESSGRTDLAGEIWPAIVSQMDYLLARRTARGLVRAREWAMWGNPVAYQTCEGAALNAFVYRALVDAASVGRRIGKRADAARYEKAATALARAYNEVLWNEAAGSYSGGGYDLGIAQAAPDYRPLPLGVSGGLIEPTRHAAMLALDQGIVPEGRRARVMAYLLAHPPAGGDAMQYGYAFSQWYAWDAERLDRDVLATLRREWQGMVEDPNGAGYESLRPTDEGFSRAHVYGCLPAYFLSAYVLGVQREGAADRKRIRIEPRLGDLETAAGTVGTEFGAVSVSWARTADGGRFAVTIPPGVKATLRLPTGGEKGSAALTGRPKTRFSRQGRWAQAELSAGVYSGTWTTAP